MPLGDSPPGPNLMIDSHCHLDFDHFDGQRDRVMADALEAGVHTVVNIGVDLETSRRSVALAERFESMYAVVGTHPHDSTGMTEAALSEFRDLTSHEKVVAVGEIGLDFYRDHSPRDAQRKWFRRQLELAVETNLPVVIHSRDSFRESMDIVSEFAGDLPGGVFHCFPGDLAQAEEVFALGFVVGVGGVATYKNSEMSRLVAAAPLDKMILETDAPYLAPTPMRGKTNEPAFVAHTCRHIAGVRGCDWREVEKTTDRTCQKLYRLVETFGE